MNIDTRHEIDSFWSGKKLFDCPNSLHTRLKFIFYKAIILIQNVEENHFKIIKNFLKIKDEKEYKNSSLFERAALASKYISNNKTTGNYLIDVYIGALDEIWKIKIEIYPITKYGELWLNELRRRESKPLELSEKEYIKFLNENLTDEKLKNDHFLNEVVPCFFSLHMYCHHLIDILNTKKRVPIDPKVRNMRAALAGNIRNYGQEELKAMILGFLYSQNPKTKYTSIENLVKSLTFDLGKILSIYHERFYMSLKNDTQPLNYGEHLKEENILRKMHEWKIDSNFRTHLERICILKN